MSEIKIEDLRIKQEVYWKGEKEKILAISILDSGEEKVWLNRFTCAIPISEISLTQPKKKVKKEIDVIVCNSFGVAVISCSEINKLLKERITNAKLVYEVEE